MSIPLSPEQFEKKPNRNTPSVWVSLDKIDSSQMYYDQAKVDDIAAKGVRETGIDPIAGKFQGRYKPLDGNHRIAAAIKRGDRRIRLKKVK